MSAARLEPAVQVARPSLLFFFDPRSGRSRRAEGFLAQVLQRRRNHETFQLYRVDATTRDDLTRKFLVEHLPALVVVENKCVTARLEQPRGCKELTEFLEPWLS
jgi:thioredoxin-like negative regulator of GroEL